MNKEEIVGREKIVGRQAELNILDRTFNSRRAELLAIYGRRRVGKTHLIREYFRERGLYFELTGLHDAPKGVQLKNFARAFADLFHKGKIQNVPGSWDDAFDQLRKKIEALKSKGRVVLFFDELPWLATRRSGFLQTLDHFWNRYFSSLNNVIVIICGSAASWMINKVVSDKGGLHGRITRMIHLLPFTLGDTERFLNSLGIDLTRREIVEIYMAMGGVPQYLMQVEPGKSAAQVTNDVCFSPNGYLYSEFFHLYASLFNNAEDHIKIVKTLSQKRVGMLREEILRKTGLTSGGRFAEILRELKEAGFIAYVPPFGNKTREGFFRLIDEYSLFFLTWIENAPGATLKPIESDYWLKRQNSQAWRSWCGYAFEALCMKHVPQIKSGLGIAAISTEESAWAFKATKKEKRGVQIDLIIDRGDSCINLCEMKYHSAEYKISRKDVENLRHKKDTFKRESRTRKNLFTTMIACHGTRVDKNYNAVVSNQVTVDQLFE
jgi:uncharacterized protein